MIERKVEQAAAGNHDVIVVGGGIYGCMIALEACYRGLRPLLIESRDFGSRTSFNSFRIIHGGLRYLQSLDIARLRESVSERSWFLRHFPGLVKPIPCLLPLYGRGLRRRSVMRLALMVNDLLSGGRNLEPDKDPCLPAGRIVDPAEALSMCPGIASADLEGGALWWDASMQDSQRVLMEILHWAVAAGGTALNYVQAEKLLVQNGRVCGIGALDHCTGRSHEFCGQLVINATGPWVRQTAALLDRDYDALFRSTLAWNILFDKSPPSDCALALQVAETGQTYFVRPFKGRLLAGTGHAEWQGSADDAAPSGAQITSMIERLNSAMPALGLERSQIRWVFAGLLPGRCTGGRELARRPVIIEHGKNGGVRNLISVSGVKFTTARRVAEAVLEAALGYRGARRDIAAHRPEAVGTEFWSCRPEQAAGLGKCLPGLRKLVEREAVVHLDDLVLRRTTLWESADLTPGWMDALCGLFPWDETRKQAELNRLAAALGPMPGSPAAGEVYHLQSPVRAGV